MNPVPAHFLAPAATAASRNPDSPTAVSRNPDSSGRGRGAAILLAAATLLWIGAMVRVGFAVRELGRLRTANEARVARIRALDPAFRDFLTRELATGHLLDQGHAATATPPARLAALCAAQSAPRPEPIDGRTLSAAIGGHPLAEVSAKWDAIPRDVLARVLRAAEDAEPPLRLRRAEITVRPDGELGVEAEFETL